MPLKLFYFLLAIIGFGFTSIFCYLVIPAFFEHPDLEKAVLGGFVNPFASTYAWDAICCWFVLATWVMHERSTVKYGWLALLLGILPGVALGFASYLILRTFQQKKIGGDTVKPITDVPTMS